MAKDNKEKTVSSKDFDYLAEYIKEEFDRREKNRKHLNHAIKEIDRQIEMRPDTSHKMIFEGGVNTGRPDPSKSWMPEIELPLQAEALETLNSDARGLLFPDTGPWFSAHAALTDEYLKRVDFASLVAGDENEVPSLLTQDNADKLVVGQMEHWHRQYRFRDHIDLINAEAFSYGTGIGRARLLKKEVFMDTARGVVRKDQVIPVLVPGSLKNTYLDDREHILMHDGFMVGPLQIHVRHMALEDLKKYAQGGDDPQRMDGGWIPRFVNKLEPDNKGFVKLLEAEGDFIIPKKSNGSLFIPNAIITIGCGKNENKVVRIRFRDIPYSTTIAFPYHKERIDTPYATSPLRKGWPLQAIATEMLNILVMSAQLSAQPPIGWDRSDTWFAQNGGPVVSPGALWGTLGDVKPHLIGSLSEMSIAYQNALLQYADVVGVHRARLGAQTLSHTTAYAKNAELQRGAVRTVDYIRTALQGPMTQWLYTEYEMGLKAMSGTNTFYIDSYRGFVEISKEHLPDQVVFEAHGAGAPVEEREKLEQKLRALAEAIQMDQVAISQGMQPTLNMQNVIEGRLREGGWTDTDPLLSKGGQTMNPMTAPPVSLQALSGVGGTEV